MTHVSINIFNHYMEKSKQRQLIFASGSFSSVAVSGVARSFSGGFSNRWNNRRYGNLRRFFMFCGGFCRIFLKKNIEIIVAV
jgi:hypothetical protein